ncbi:TIGR04222 domain-containing membrane protein [Actinomadura welshii]
MPDGLSGAALGFLAGYLCLGLGLLAVQLLLRARVRRGRPPAGEPGPHEIAYLHDRERRAIAVSVAALRLDHAVDALDDGRLLASRPAEGRPRTAGTPLDEAVLAAVAGERAGAIDEIEDDAAVSAELDRIGEGLAEQGLLADPVRRRPLWAVQVALLAWAGAGLKIFIEEEVVSGFPAVLLPWAGIGGIGLAGLVFGAGGKRTREGERLTERLRASNAHLDPRGGPSRGGLTAPELLLAVGLHGAPAMLASDPDFTRASGLDRYLDGGAAGTAAEDDDRAAAPAGAPSGTGGDGLGGDAHGETDGGGPDGGGG